jgi:hypothetical protein
MLARPTSRPAPTKKTPASPQAALIVTASTYRLVRPTQLSALQRPDFQQQRQGSDNDDEQQQSEEDEQQQLVGRPEPPGRKYSQLWKSKRPRRKPRVLDGAQLGLITPSARHAACATPHTHEMTAPSSSSSLQLQGTPATPCGAPPSGSARPPCSRRCRSSTAPMRVTGMCGCTCRSEA